MTIALADGAGAITHRFEEVSKAVGKTNEAWLDAADDPFLDDQTRPKVVGALEAAEKALTALVSVDHLSPADRASLRHDLDAGWTTSTESRLIAHLDQSAVA